MLCLWQRSTMRFLSSADQVATADKLSPFVRRIAIRKPYRGGQQDDCHDKYAIFYQKFIRKSLPFWQLLTYSIDKPKTCGIFFFFNPIQVFFKGSLSAKSVELSRPSFYCRQFSYEKIMSLLTFLFSELCQKAAGNFFKTNILKRLSNLCSSQISAKNLRA